MTPYVNEGILDERRAVLNGPKDELAHLVALQDARDNRLHNHAVLAHIHQRCIDQAGRQCAHSLALTPTGVLSCSAADAAAATAAAIGGGGGERNDGAVHVVYGSEGVGGDGSDRGVFVQSFAAATSSAAWRGR